MVIDIQVLNCVCNVMVILQFAFFSCLVLGFDSATIKLSVSSEVEVLMDILLMGASSFRKHSDFSFSMKFPLYSNVLSSMTFMSLSTSVQLMELI